ncbi:MAG: putative N-formylglutamate amidohydrolase [Parasphingorhabdus sp.]|jgi:predicted N-formylglutamate amidohydrolase
MTHKYTSIFDQSAILLPSEQPSYEIINPDGKAQMVITCDHASNRVPKSLQNLGLETDEFEKHIAYDLGCSKLSERMAELLDAPMLRTCFSRLVIDANRHLNDPGSIPEISDGITVPANQQLSRLQAGQRVEELFVPYHNAIASSLAEVQAKQGVPILIAMHSFTPVFKDFERPWHVGVLWNRDDRISAPLIERLRSYADLCVGDNQPYHAKEPVGYSMDVHAEGNGYPHILLEIRQDLLSDTAGVEYWAQLLCREISVVTVDPSIYQVKYYDS